MVLLPPLRFQSKLEIIIAYLLVCLFSTQVYLCTSVGQSLSGGFSDW